ncbi:MAG: glycosyltransferase [Haemophilus parainfluenzae]
MSYQIICIQQLITERKNRNQVSICSITKNMGLALALNEGLKVAKGNFIARMDTDDIAERDRFKVQFEFLQQHVDVDYGWLLICEMIEMIVLSMIK